MRLDPGQAGHDRQSLASALRDLRRAAGLSGERLARRCHMSQSKVSRIENGRLLPSVIDVDRMLRALDVDQATSAELLALNPGQSKTVQVTFPVSELAVTQGDIDGAGVPSVETGSYQVQIGTPATLSATFTVH